MSTPFDGTWVGERNIAIDVTSVGDFLTAQYSQGGAAFTGFAGTFGRPVIYVQLGGNAPYTGVMTTDGNTILWSNQTQWKRQGASADA